MAFLKSIPWWSWLLIIAGIGITWFAWGSMASAQEGETIAPDDGSTGGD